MGVSALARWVGTPVGAVLWYEAHRVKLRLSDEAEAEGGEPPPWVASTMPGRGVSAPTRPFLWLGGKRQAPVEFAQRKNNSLYTERVLGVTMVLLCGGSDGFGLTFSAERHISFHPPLCAPVVVHGGKLFAKYLTRVLATGLPLVAFSYSRTREK